MTYGEFEKKLTDLLSQPDSALANAKGFMEEVKADYESIISLTDKVSKNDARIRDLQDTNMKLFLAQTGQVKDSKEEDDDDLEGFDAVEAFVNKLNKEEE